MQRGWRFSLLPSAMAFAAIFLALPTLGAHTTVHIVREGKTWAFKPSTETFVPGERVAFVNDTTATHAATCDACGWESGDIEPGQTKFVTIPARGQFSYHCRYHSDMTGLLKA